MGRWEVWPRRDNRFGAKKQSGRTQGRCGGTPVFRLAERMVGARWLACVLRGLVALKGRERGRTGGSGCVCGGNQKGKQATKQQPQGKDAFVFVLPLSSLCCL